MTLVVAAPAHAGVSRTYEHSWEQVWSGTVRLLRVDRGFKIAEKDPDTGYILFEFKDSPRDERVYTGSAELIRAEDSTGRPVVRLTFNIAGKSSIPHDVLHRALVDKLKREYGEPLRPAPAKKKAPVDDDKDEDDGDGDTDAKD